MQVLPWRPGNYSHDEQTDEQIYRRCGLDEQIDSKIVRAKCELQN